LVCAIKKTSLIYNAIIYPKMFKGINPELTNCKSIVQL